jgi:hypothetical protein
MIDDLIDELAAERVHEGHPAERRLLAGRLLSAGITVGDVQALAEHVRRTVRDQDARPAVLASILSDDRDARLRLADLAEIVAARARRAARESAVERPLPHEVRWVPDRIPADASRAEVDRWCRDDRANYVRCRIDGDRATAEEVAREIGVPERDIATILARGRELLRAAAPIPATTAGPDSAEIDELKAALRTAVACEKAGRPIPSAVVDRCLSLRHRWPGHEIPDAIAKASPAGKR